VTQREPEEVSFAARTVRPPRRRIDPLFLGVAAVVVAIGFLIVKPWQAPSQGSASTLRPSGAFAAAPSVAVPTGSSHASAAPQAGPDAPYLDWAEVTGVLQPHEEWGARAIIQTVGPEAVGAVSGLAERWAPLPSEGPTAALPSDEQAVLALGLTFPPTDAPVDVRILQAISDGTWRWLDARPVGDAPIGSFLFLPPTVDGRTPMAWPAGDYAFSILLRGQATSVEIRLTGRFGRTPIAEPDPLPDPRLKGAALTDLGSLQPGAFVIADGIATHLAVDGAGGTLGPAAAWLAPDGDELLPGPVARWFAPRANGLGVIIPSDSTGLEATIERVYPIADRHLDAPATRGTRITGLGIEMPYVIFSSPGDRPFMPGLYLIDARWTAPDGPASATYHVELEPGDAPVGSFLLAASRLTAADVHRLVLVGADGVDRLELDDDVAADLVGDRGCAPPPPAVDTSGTSVIAVQSFDRIGDAVVTMAALAGSGAVTPIPLLIARDPDRQGMLIAREDRAIFTPGVYRLTITNEGLERTATICLGHLGSN
jgi:hypothetical protein